MNFDVNTKLSFNVGAVTVGKTARVNYSHKDSPLPEMDYSDSVDDDSVTLGEIRDVFKFITNPKEFWGEYIVKNMIGDAARTTDTTFAIEKGTTTAGWATTKWVWADLVQAVIGSKANEKISWMCLSILATSALEGGHKVGIKELSGLFTNKDMSQKLLAEFGKGFTKASTSALMKDNPLKTAIIKTFEKVPLPKNLKLIDLGKLVEKSGWKPIKPGSFWDKIMSNNIRQFSQNKTSNGVKKFSGKFSGSTVSIGDFASSLGTAFGIDYISGVASNLIGGWIEDGELEFSDAKLGSTALKSSTKIIFATAGEIAFGKAGKIVGTAVGSFIGEFQVAAFTDENGNIQEGWCAAAAGAQLVGAVAGAAIIACLVSNPAGWVVCAAILVGAAVGFAVTWVAKEVVENFERITNAVDEVMDTAKIVVGEIKEYAHEVIDDIGEAVQANPVTNFLIGWAF